MWQLASFFVGIQTGLSVICPVIQCEKEEYVADMLTWLSCYAAPGREETE